ncbi:MAG TPA: ribokinase [Rhizomicrobium sp.]|jgi:ribokinase
MSVCVLGSINLDLVCRVVELPGPGETVTALDLARFAGGKGANQAAASARWGACTYMVGAVGKDDAGDELLAHLSSAGVNVSGVARVPGAPTGQAYISVSSAGENMIVVVGGANRTVSTEQVRASAVDGHAVLLSQLETPLAAIEALFAGPRKGLRILNAAPAVPDAKTLFRFLDMLIVNETELAHYAGAARELVALPEIAGAARSLIVREGQRVIVTLGARGAVAVDAESVIEVPGRAVQVVDTTGAGDCFCGVLAASLDEGFALPDAMHRANVAAAISTQTAGAAVIPTLRVEVDALL